MLNILYIQSTSEIGGSDISLMRMIERLDRERFRPFVILPGPGPLVAELERHGCEIHFCAAMLKLTSRRGFWYPLRYLINYPFAVIEIAWLIGELKIHLVHTNSLHNLYGLPAAKITGRPHVWHVREIVLQSNFLRAIELWLARTFSDRIIVTSGAVASMFRKTDKPLPKGLLQIPNGIDLSRFNPAVDGSKIRKEIGVSQSAPLVGLVGRLDHWKGVDLFLRAAALCHQEIPSARFAVIGGAVPGREIYAEDMKRLARELNVEEAVIFSGSFAPERIPEVHAALNVLVLASTWPEPFGLVLLEAMATAKPVVATAHGGPVEIIADGETGILVEPEPAVMSAAILSLLRQSDLAEKMGKAGRRRAAELYDQERNIRKIENVYAGLLGLKVKK